MLKSAGFEALQQSLCRYTPDIPDEHDRFTLETKDPGTSPVQWIVISEHAWEILAPLIEALRTLPSPATQTSRAYQAVASASSPGHGDQCQCALIIKWGGRIVTRVPFRSSDTMESVKAQIQDNAGIPVDQQALVYKGKRLKDGGTLSHYAIPFGASIHLLIRLRGENPVPLSLDKSDRRFINFFLERLVARVKKLSGWLR